MGYIGVGCGNVHSLNGSQDIYFVQISIHMRMQRESWGTGLWAERHGCVTAYTYVLPNSMDVPGKLPYLYIVDL